MNIKFFDGNESNYALKLVETNPKEALNRLEDYLKKYPRDYHTRVHYVMLLLRLCKFNEANSEYNKIINEINGNNYYSSDAKTLTTFKHNLIVAKIRLLAYDGKYYQLIEFVKKNKDNLTDSEYYSIIKLCRCKLRIITNEQVERLNLSYRYMQMLNYSEKDFIDHVKRHEADFGEEFNKTTLFAQDFPIDDIIKEVKKHIPSNDRIFPGIFDDAYYFKYDNCGRVNNSPTNYFYVVCYHNTTNIITMYPVADARHLNPVDLNYIRKIDESKDKRESQIEKFNRRFHR